MAVVLLIVSVCAACTFTGAESNASEPVSDEPSASSELLEPKEAEQFEQEPLPPAYSLSCYIKIDSLHTIESTQFPLTDDKAAIAENVIMYYLVKSSARPGVDIDTLDGWYLIHAVYSDGTAADYYAYMLDGNAVLQNGSDGSYSTIDNGLYAELAQVLIINEEPYIADILDTAISKAILDSNLSNFNNAMQHHIQFSKWDSH